MITPRQVLRGPRTGFPRHCRPRSMGTARPASSPVFKTMTWPRPAKRTGATIQATRPACLLNGDRARGADGTPSRRKARIPSNQSAHDVGRAGSGRSCWDRPLGTSIQEEHPNQLQRSDQWGCQPHSDARARCTERSRRCREQRHLCDTKRPRPRRFVCVDLRVRDSPQSRDHEHIARKRGGHTVTRESTPSRS